MLNIKDSNEEQEISGGSCTQIKNACIGEQRCSAGMVEVCLNVKPPWKSTLDCSRNSLPYSWYFSGWKVFLKM